MDIIILLIILASVVFAIRTFFNTELRNNAQIKIDTIRKERIFWRLVNGYDGFNFTINAILTVHLDPNHLATFITSSNSRTEDDTRVLNLIKGKKIFDCISIINKALEKSDNSITQFLVNEEKTYTKNDIKKIFDGHKEECLIVPEKYDDFIGYYLRLLPDHPHFKAIDIWTARKKLEEVAGKLEWKTDELKVDTKTLFALKKSQVEIGEVIGHIILGEEVTNRALQEAITDWEHLIMLRWCIVDMVVPWNNTNLIQRFFWNVVAEIAPQN